MSINLNYCLTDGIRYLEKWRERYSNDDYASKVILNIFYRQYAMDFIWNSHILNSFNNYENSETEVLAAYQKIEIAYSSSAENFVSNNRISSLIDEDMEIGGLYLKGLQPLILKAKKEDNEAIEELEFSYFYWLLANKSIMMWAAFGRIGFCPIESVKKVTGAIIKMNQPFTYKNTLSIFGELTVSNFLKKEYVPLKPKFMNTYEQDYLSAMEAYQNGNYQNAIYFWEKSISAVKFAGLPKEIQKETIETGYFNLGNAKKESSDYFGALECYKIALNSNPGKPEFEKGYRYLQECCFELNTPDSLRTAIKFLDICTKFFPSDEGAFMNKGIAYINLDETYNARREFESAKALGNEDAQTFLNDYC